MSALKAVYPPSWTATSWLLTRTVADWSTAPKWSNTR